jgi:hypothetical protein
MFSIEKFNAEPAHSLDGGVPSCFHVGRQRLAASDVRR